MNDTCPLCQHTQSRSFFELPEMPVSIGVQWATAEAARACRSFYGQT